MARLRNAERALRTIIDTSQQPYICRACRAQTIRQFHSSRTLSAADEQQSSGFFKRLQGTLFGSKKEEAAEKQREEKRAQRIEALAETKAPGLQTVQGKAGQEYEIAALVDPSTNKQYVTATTWDGLERIGGEHWVRKRADQGEKYQGFAPKQRIKLTADQWSRLLHHVAVEVQALQKAGRDLNEVCSPRSDNPYNAVGNLEPLLQGISKAVAEGELKEAEESDGWMNISLEDQTVKLAILKRTMQLTGHRLPDPIISSAKTLLDLHSAFKTPDPPKKLAESQQLQSLSKQTPNVQVHATRRTPIHHEKAVGRWKIIADELEARDLPVTGRKSKGMKREVL